ncbi:MAG: LeuA family protein [Candidatus Acidiferrales bacterium]
MEDTELIYDWNTAGPFQIRTGRKVTLADETLRDGLQSPSVRDPSIGEKIEILHMMESLGIEMLDIGFPGTGPRAYADTEALAREIAMARLNIRPICAARTLEEDIQPIAEISQRAGIAIEAAMFIGSSPVRRLVEDWTVDDLRRSTESAIRFAVSQGLRAMYVTEDTVRTDPESVRMLYQTALDCGAKSFVLCDTVGYATPPGAYALVKFVREKVVEPSRQAIRVDWHGHCDRGLGVANSFAAIAAGADQIHAAAISLGERVGNTPMEQMLVNMYLEGMIDRDLSGLRKYCETVARATGVSIPPNYPIVGRDAFRTATGIHAAAIIKAYEKKQTGLADAVYSGVPAHAFGFEQIIEIGPLSGKSNVTYWLEKHGIRASDALVSRIFEAAKKSDRVLTESEILALCDGGEGQ